jgi:homogentisate 1,2-dioxygenase
MRLFILILKQMEVNSCDFVIDFQQHKKITFKCSYFHRSSIMIENGNYTTLKQQMVVFGGIG